MSGSTKFEDILPLLVSTYQQGRLVPFLGAGMSAPTLNLWGEFIRRLEVRAELHRHDTGLSPDARAQQACTIIRNKEGRDGLLAAVKEALASHPVIVPESTTSLAQIRWPLVISTNYDDLFFYACRCSRSSESDPERSSEMNVQVLGRSSRDCKLVVSSLTGPFDRQYIWHIQGFLGGQFPGLEPENDIPNIEALRDQLVIGHSEYRRVTNRAPEFRRCFTEVFNTRSFLFLGSSLREDYFLNLFGEVLDLCGPSAVPHFAFTEKGQVDPGFLADQMNITVCEFPSGEWQEIPYWLDCLNKEIKKPKARSTGWSYAIQSSTQAGTCLQIILGCAPKRPGPGEAIGFVAGRDEKNHPVPPHHFADLASERHHIVPGHEHVFYYPDRGLYAVTAHCRPNDDESAVRDALHDLLGSVIEMNSSIATVHFEFSASGGTVPPVYAFIEVVRAFGEWRAQEQNPPLRLILYIQSDVELCLTSGRVDVHELLASRLIRFWVVVISCEMHEPVRRAMHCCSNTPVKEVLRDVGVPLDSHWSVSVCPSPRKKDSRGTTPKRTAHVQDLTIIEMGIAFGSVLILEYHSKDTKRSVDSSSVAMI
jgi:hypothetical protein